MTYNGIDVSQAAENGFYSDGCQFIYGPFVNTGTYTCTSSSTSPVNQAPAFSSANYNSFKQTDFKIQPCNAIKNMLDVMLVARENSNDKYENFNRVIVFYLSSAPDIDNDNCDFSEYYPYYYGLSVLFVTSGLLCEIPFTDFTAGPCTSTTNNECLQPSEIADWFDMFITTTDINAYVLTPWDGYTAESTSFNYGTSARKMLDPLTNWICDGLFLFFLFFFFIFLVCVVCVCACLL